MRAVILTTLLAMLPAGCSFGPKVIEKTHGKYAESVRKVEEEQVLRQFVLLPGVRVSPGVRIGSCLPGGFHVRFCHSLSRHCRSFLD